MPSRWQQLQEAAVAVNAPVHACDAALLALIPNLPAKEYAYECCAPPLPLPLLPLSSSPPPLTMPLILGKLAG